MKIDVSDLLKKTGNETRVSGKEPFSFAEDELPLRGPVSFDLRLVSTGNSTLLLRGRFSADVALNCVRCLKEFKSLVEVVVEEQCSRKLKAHSKKKEEEEEIELKDDDFTFPISEDNMIDLSEAIRQNLITALPIKPLCKKSCKGFEKVEAKERKNVDPRLAKLKDMLK